MKNYTIPQGLDIINEYARRYAETIGIAGGMSQIFMVQNLQAQAIKCLGEGQASYNQFIKFYEEALNNTFFTLEDSIKTGIENGLTAKGSGFVTPF